MNRMLWKNAGLSSGRVVGHLSKPVGELFQTNSHVLPRALVLLLAVMQAPVAAVQPDPRIDASSRYATELQQQLGGRLKSAIQEGGVVHAIEVCQVEAPRIAADLSASGSPSRVWRTALKVRNPMNSPDAGALEILQEFTAAMAGDETAPQSRFIAHPDGSARFMQSITTQEICLACHGDSLAPEVKQALDERYPEDQATGFVLGDLRGAFVVDWPASQ